MATFLWRRFATLVLAFFLLLPGVVSAQKLTAGWSAVSALNAPFWVMKEAGFFDREGLDVSRVYIPRSSTMAQAQVSGEVQISTANSQVIVDSGLRGGDLLAIGASKQCRCNRSRRRGGLSRLLIGGLSRQGTPAFVAPACLHVPGVWICAHAWFLLLPIPFPQ